RRPDQVGEDDRDDLARAGVLGRARDERGAAAATELRRRRDVSAAAVASPRQRRTAFLAEAIGRTILVATRFASHRHRPDGWCLPSVGAPPAGEILLTTRWRVCISFSRLHI